jgi:hypothetical protein
MSHVLSEPAETTHWKDTIVVQKNPATAETAFSKKKEFQIPIKNI